MSYTIPTFDALLDQILTDYRNQSAEISAETTIRAACLASAIWGAYKYQEYLSKQPFPDTADTENLNHHGAVQGVTRLTDETDADYLARILDDIQNPAAGGNLYDYRQWTEEIYGVAAAYVVPLAQGDGTVDVVVVADEDLTGSEIPSASMRKGTATSVGANKLYDTAADFTAALAVSVGDLVRNTFQGTEAHVVIIDAAGEITLDADIFKYVGEHYHIHLHTGTSTTATANKLIDEVGAFNNAAYIVKKGDVVKNLTKDTEALVVTVDSALQLALDTDIFTDVGDAYVVESLLARVKENIDAKRPVTSSMAEVFAPTILTQNVTMGVSGTNVDRAKIALDITALLNGYIPDQKLYEPQLTTLAVERGAEDTLVTVPAAFPVTPASYQMIRPGVIAVT